jgi:hypothetical protein
MTCEYCNSVGKIRVGKQDGLEKDIYVCDNCWDLLKNPATALPLLRSHLSMNLKGKVQPMKLDRMINKYMEMISGWKARN